MAISEKQKQKKLLKKKQKRASVAKTSKGGLNLVSPQSCAAYPVFDCVMPDNLFELGIGEVMIAKRLPNGQLAVSAFIVDVFCLGVKNAFFRLMDEVEYEDMKDDMMGEDKVFDPITEDCAKKLLEGAVDYAKNLGFKSHADYAKAAALFSSKSGKCSIEFEYGQDGKPFYFRGPHETLDKASSIVAKLREKCGEDGFEYTIPL